MRLLISGGGTGGHIYPAITIAKTLADILKNNEKCEILFVGTKEGLEADIIPNIGFTFKTISIQGFSRKISLENIFMIKNIIISFWQSWKIITKFKPDVVIGTGGYVCGPVLFVASLMGIVTVIQEQNVIAGLTNRILAKFVDKIAVGYLETKKCFGKSQTKIIVTGNPIRAEIINSNREQSIKELNLDPKKRTILVVGGSRGSRTINQIMPQVYKYFADRKDIQLIHVTGHKDYNNILDSITQIKPYILAMDNIIIQPYLHNMHLALAATDLAIFRAGAISLAELTVKGIASILIPYPYSAGNHQEHNANIMKKYGASIVISDAEINSNNLIKNIEYILNDSNMLKKMAKASLSLGRPEAAKNIAKLVIKLVKK